jgi:hypothetical protein
MFAMSSEPCIGKVCKQLPPIAYDALIPVTHFQKLQHPRYGKIGSRITFYFSKSPLVKDKRNQDCILHKSQNVFSRASSDLRPVEYWIMTRTFPYIDITAAGLSAFLHICKKYLDGSVPPRLHRLRNEWSEKPLVRDPYAIGKFSYKEVKRMMYNEMYEVACLTGKSGPRRSYANNAWTELISEYQEFLNRLMQRTGLESTDVFYTCEKEGWKAQKVIKAWLENHGRHVHYGNLDEVYFDDPPLSDLEHRSLQDAVTQAVGDWCVIKVCDDRKTLLETDRKKQQERENLRRGNSCKNWKVATVATAALATAILAAFIVVLVLYVNKRKRSLAGSPGKLRPLR